MEFEFLKFLVDHWLGNIYFEIVRLPRYLAGQKEYEVELQFRLGQMFFYFIIDEIYLIKIKSEVLSILANVASGK